MAPSGAGSIAPGGERERQLRPATIVRAAILLQAAYRRSSLEDCRRVLGIRATIPSPSVAVAMEFSRRMRRQELSVQETEAMAVAAIICSKERLTLGPLTAAYQEYEQALGVKHPVLLLLEERFGEVLMDAEEDLRVRLLQATKPSLLRESVEQVRQAWDAPNQRLGGGELFPLARSLLRDLKRKAEVELTSRLATCQTREAYELLASEVERELGDGHTVLRARVRAGMQSHRQQIEMMCQSTFGWPPRGAPRVLLGAARWYAAELDPGHCLVEDFAGAARRECRRLERQAEKELGPWAAELTRLRKHIAADPARPRLLREALLEELREQEKAAAPLLERWQGELGHESLVLEHLACQIRSPEVFLPETEDHAHTAAASLRALCGPEAPALGSADRAEARLTAASRLWQALEVLQAEGAARAAAAARETDLEEDLEWLAPLMALTAQEGGLELDGGWHMPPGFVLVDHPAVPQKPQERPPLEKPEPVKVPEPRSEMDVCMRLHGVSGDDARKRSEILLLEKCAAIIARECGIPREWISNIHFGQSSSWPADPQEST